VPSLGPQPRLVVVDEAVVVDHLHGFVERRLVRAAVVVERRAVLVDDLVLVGERVALDVVLAPDLQSVDPKLTRAGVEQSLHHEHAVLPTGAAHRRHDRLVRERNPELAVVVRHDVRPEQRTLAVDGNREPIRIVRARVVQKKVLDPEHGAVGRERNLGVVNL
jgi:hypothetical protein